MNWNHGSSWGENVCLEGIEDGFRPNETGFEEKAFYKTIGRLWYSYRFDEGSKIRSFYISGYHFHQTNAEKLLRNRRTGSSRNVGVGKFDFYLYGGLGQQRDRGQLFDRRFIGTRFGYRPKWGRFRMSNEFGTRQENSIGPPDFSTNIDLFGRLTPNFALNNYFWRERQDTHILGLRGSYQFARRMDWLENLCGQRE